MRQRDGRYEATDIRTDKRFKDVGSALSGPRPPAVKLLPVTYETVLFPWAAVVLAMSHFASRGKGGKT